MKTKLILLLIFCSYFSCKKNNENLSDVFQDKDLVDRDFVITKILQKFNTTDPYATETDVITFKDYYALAPDCTKDDIYRYDTGGIHLRLPGDNNCGGNDSGYNYGWEINTSGELVITRFNLDGSFWFSFTQKLLKTGVGYFETYTEGTIQSSLSTVPYVRIERYEYH